MEKAAGSYRELILAEVESLVSPPIAIECLWDGDSTGWFVCLSAVTADQRSHPLGVIREGGDIRLFNGQVPPWPEALAAQDLGEELARRFGAEFYFPSPNHPEDECPSWRNRRKGYPCRRCGIPLLQPRRCPWRGTCYQCHLAEKQEKREAVWTAEERAGPRCHVCGNPATKELDGAPACAACFERYEVYDCERCNAVVMIAKSDDHGALCSLCELRIAVDSLTASQRKSIRNAMAKSELEGIRSAVEILNCPFHRAEYALNLLKEGGELE